MPLHVIALHAIALHVITLHVIVLHVIALHVLRDGLRDRDNTAGIGANSAEIRNDAAGIVDIAANVIPC